MSYKRIIVAVDGSDTSEQALMEALELSKALQAKLGVIHVVDIFPVYNLAIGIDYDRYREIIRNEGLAILENIGVIAKNNDCQIETQLIEITDASKKISEKIIEASQQWKADLLVIGTHGRRGFNRLILGSVAEESIRISPMPVLLIRARE